jgi:[ribosomal protein S18]-alanine N-acetyltransferase
MAVAAILRHATEADVPALAELERLAFETPNWPAETFSRYDCTIAEIDGQMAGFLVSRQIFAGDSTAPPEREILNLAVAPAHRRAGLATQLLQFELRYRAVFLLEVRESNLAARALYENLGFVEISRRRAYYDNPPETAIVMQLKAFVSLIQ